MKAQHETAIYCCDPVMGDIGPGLFVAPAVPAFFANMALPAADIVTPNVFELSVLTGMPVAALASTTVQVAAARSLISCGPCVVLLTSARCQHARGEERIATFAVTAREAWAVSTPFVPLTPMPDGMGDCAAARFRARYLQHHDIALALSQSVSSLYALARRADANMPRDLNLIAMQDALVQPPETFASEVLCPIKR